MNKISDEIDKKIEEMEEIRDNIDHLIDLDDEEYERFMLKMQNSLREMKLINKLTGTTKRKRETQEDYSSK